MADKNGHIDMTYQHMCAVSGWPMELLKQAITELMAPDPESRSADSDGRRLELLDPENRQWGWRVVNHEKYRNKARKAAYDADRTASGADAERKRLSRRVPTWPDASRQLPPSDADTNADTNKSKNKSKSALRATRVPADFAPDLAYAASQLPDIDAEAEAQKFRDHEYARPKSDWPACWRTWIRNCKDNGRYSRRPKANEVLGNDGRPVKWM